MELIHLTKKYRSKNRYVTAVNDVSLSFPNHGLLFLLGESGAGKTTLLQLLTLQEKPTSGSVILCGTDIWKGNRKVRNRAKSCGFALLSQELNLLSEFSVYDNLRLSREAQGENISREDAAKALLRFGLGEELLDEMPDHLSGGQRARVALARAYVRDFHVLVVDEPTASLDQENAEGVMRLLAEIAKDRLVIAATHDTSLAEKYGDRVIRMEGGQVVSDSHPLEEKTDEKEENWLGARPRLPFRAVIRLAFHGAFQSIPRFVFSLLSSILTLAAFMATLSFCFYNERNTSLDAFASENITYTSLSYTIVISENSYVEGDPYPFALQDEEEIQNIFGKTSIYRSKSIDITNSELTGMEEVFTIPSEDLSPFDFSIVGRFPSNENPLEIALTKYDCKQLGWLDGSSDETATMSKIIQEKTCSITFQSSLKEDTPREAKVVGIIDTHYEPKAKAESYREKQIENNRALYEVHGGVFFSPSFYREIVLGAQEKFGLYVPLSSHPLDAIDTYNALKKPVLLPDGEEGYLSLQNGTRLKTSLNDITSFQDTYKQAGIVVTVFLTLATSFAFVAMISSSVRALSPSVRILRSLGISALAVQSIYALEVESISLLCGLVAILPYYYIIQGLKQFVWNYFFLTVSPFSFSWIIVLISLVSLLALGILLSLLVSEKESLQKPNRYIH